MFKMLWAFHFFSILTWFLFFLLLHHIFRLQSQPSSVIYLVFRELKIYLYLHKHVGFKVRKKFLNNLWKYGTDPLGRFWSVDFVYVVINTVYSLVSREIELNLQQNKEKLSIGEQHTVILFLRVTPLVSKVCFM